MTRHPNLQPLLIKLGIEPPDTEFNRRAAEYAKRAVREAQTTEAWARSPRNKRNQKVEK